MTLREMSPREVWRHFGDLTHRGVVVEDASGNVIASVGYKQFDNALYAHSLNGDGGMGAPMIVQYLRKLRDDLALSGVHFSFDENNPCWEGLIKSGRVKVTGYNAILEL
jgi:hypothetical protein